MIEIPGWAAVNGFTFALICLLLAVSRGPDQNRNNHRLTYLRLVLLVLALLVGDTFSRLPHEGGTREIALLGTYFIFAFDPLGYYFALRYIESWIDGKRSIRETIVRSVLMFYSVLNIVLVTIAQLTGSGWFYAYHGSEYIRGPLYIPRGIANLMFCIAVEFYVFLRRRQINATYRPALLCFPLFVFAGGALQITLEGYQFEYAGTVMALLMLYTQVQMKDVNQDFLTGTSNRRYFDTVLAQKIAAGKPFAGIMIDVDFFKSINDTWGHTAGDEALRNVSAILRRTFPNASIIARYGGDEFCVLTDSVLLNELVVQIRELGNAVADFNAQNGDEPYRLSLSVGSALWNPSSGEDYSSFLARMDASMYEDKKRHHGASAR